MPHHVVVTDQQPGPGHPQQQPQRCPHGVPVGAYCQGCHQQWLAAQQPRPVVVVQQGKKPTSTVGCLFGVILAPIVLLIVFFIIGALSK